MIFDLIAFDADDTLWHNEIIYIEIQQKLRKLLAKYVNPDLTEDRLYETEMTNIKYYGYGIKSFTLSMIELAIQLTKGRIVASDINEIIGYGKEMLISDVQLIDHVENTVQELSAQFDLMVITKGDLRDQEYKLINSGISQYFHCVEIVSEKIQETYSNLLRKYRIHPDRFLMVGNSLRSDILPVIATGGYAVHIPYATTWAHEVVDNDHPDHAKLFELEDIEKLPGLINHLSTT